ncbi:unnamed protein product [Paramecium octaurelia]|uniref:Uncharacterized protein n=1 Tax=Paramecium octaurelia TaxID=43137 RepID=A0A8S1XT78_PAROT|nr:unnamed protein product [Paramecium octaurelia]
MIISGFTIANKISFIKMSQRYCVNNAISRLLQQNMSLFVQKLPKDLNSQQIKLENSLSDCIFMYLFSQFST